MHLAPKVLRLACILVAPAVGLFAGGTSEAPSPLPKTVAVAAFKNGLAFVLRQGEVPLFAGTGRIASIPNATLGTLWLAPGNPEARIDEVVAYRYTTPGQRPIPSIGEILRANAGKTVTITYQMKEYTGEVVGFKDASPEPTAGSITPVDARYTQREDYLLLRMDKRLMAFPLGGISMASLPDDAVLRETVERQSQALRLKVKGGSSREKLSMGYLEHGLGWTPSYLISLTDDTNAQITMQAVVTNDAEDVQNAEFFFVVGVPNFAYANTLSPMSLQQSLVDFMKDAERDEDRKKTFSNAIGGQLAMYDRNEAALAPVNLAGGVDEMASAPEEDLFLYSRSDVTLAKGERASYNVFSGNVSYEHLYNWEVEDQPRVDAFGNVINPNQNVQDSARADSIWHSIRLKNSTKFPWTSAPALVMSGDKPVSQDTLTYTPKAANSTLRITVATDIRASHEEREVARQQELNHRRNYNYDLVTVEGKLKVKNFKTKQVHLAIGKTLRGKTEVQSDEGKSVQLGEGIESDNPRSRLSWEITLKPGEERVITYRYRIWVRA
jgi:hypothetical protein